MQMRNYDDDIYALFFGLMGNDISISKANDITLTYVHTIPFQ
jgi:hypothetical protein